MLYGKMMKSRSRGGKKNVENNWIRRERGREEEGKHDEDTDSLPLFFFYLFIKASSGEAWLKVSSLAPSDTVMVPPALESVDAEQVREDRRESRSLT